jgi:hypothetical protein
LQSATQWPPVHVGVLLAAEQTLPHPPQLLASFLGFVHVRGVPQQSSPVSQLAEVTHPGSHSNVVPLSWQIVPAAQLSLVGRQSTHWPVTV